MRGCWIGIYSVGVIGALLGCAQQAGPRVAEGRMGERHPVKGGDVARVEEVVVEEVSASDAIWNLAVLLSRNGRNVGYLQRLTEMAQGRLVAQVRVLAL